MSEPGVVTVQELKKMLDAREVDLVFDLRNPGRIHFLELEGRAPVDALNIPQEDFVGEEGSLSLRPSFRAFAQSAFPHSQQIAKIPAIRDHTSCLLSGFIVFFQSNRAATISTCEERMPLSKGTLWKRLVETTEQALACGALLPVATNEAFIEDGGIRFFVRVLSSLRLKDEARSRQDADAKAGKKANPFLPPERELTVGAITETHTAILNKFNVVEHHLLIVTNHFEDQDLLLTLRDFEALWLCMTEYDSLGFYNGGREAGASQQHKHLQLVPLPLAPGGPAVPIDSLLPRSGPRNSPKTVPAFSFLHSFVRLDPGPAIPSGNAARKLFELYALMLRQVNLTPPDPNKPTTQSRPYCLLVTREWMLLVPRSREFFEDISFNSLAFAGSLFVRNEAQLRRLKAYGPLNALKAVAIEKT